MVTLFDSFVMWFNGLFGLEYAGYGWVTAIVGGILAIALSFGLLKLAVRPLMPLFGAEHSKIGSERPSINKGVREFLQPEDSFSPRPVQFTDSFSQMNAVEDIPFIQILPLEDFNHICPEASKLAGQLADGLAATLKDIPNVDVDRAYLDTLRDGTSKEGTSKFVVSGSVKSRENDIVVTVNVRDTCAGDQFWTQSSVCLANDLADLEREFAVDIASAVLQRHRETAPEITKLQAPSSTVARSGSMYPNGRRPSPVIPGKTRRQAM